MIKIGVDSTRMISVGETLRRERLRRNLDLEKISQELKISIRMLEAIEGEQFDRLPGGVFAKSFVRQYAQLLGLDEEEMAAEVQRILRPESEPLPAAETARADIAPIALPKVEEWRSVGGRRNWSSFLPSAVLVVVVMLLCSAVYAYWQRTHRPVSARNIPAHAQPAPDAQPVPYTAPAAPAAGQPAEAAAPQPSNQPVAQPPVSAKPAVQTPPPAAQAVIPAASPTPQQAATPGAVHVELTATEAAWVLVRADGKYLFSGTLDPNQSRTVDANTSVLLWLGNAGGVDVALNGKPLGSLGPKGQVRTYQLTSGGFQAVVADPKPTVPVDPL